MKLFKKALLATAIFGAMGAQAADVSDAVKFTSEEGFAAANNVVGADGSVRVIVREKLEAGDKVTLQFGKGFDVDGVEDVAYTAGVRDVLTSGNIGIDNGTADYTFTLDTVESDFAKGKVVLVLDTGYTVELDESFEVVASAGAFLTTATQSNATLTYSAARWQDGVAKDTVGDNTGTYLVFANQYGATVTNELNGVIERTAGADFVSGQITTSDTADSFTVSLTDKTEFLDAVVDATTATTFEVSGDFTDLVATDVTFTATGDILAADIAVDSLTDNLLTFTVTDTGADGQAGTLTGTIENATTRIAAGEAIKATSFVANAEVDYGYTTDAVVLSNASLGKWMVDATIINVPYFPVGFDGVSTSVHFANESASDVDVIMTAIDQAGNEYSSDALADLAADTVTKVGQSEIMSLLGAPAGSKLSITFNIDANDGDVNAYAFSNAGTGRQSLVTSQQKGK
ncbi:hypothetical protein V6260_18025 [Pseudoalteromonas aliena]|uniref:hypothetical protein n=1 Tax=Pseudoalteromonas aliena TaxID=247523 RepID=UPI00311F5BA6